LLYFSFSIGITPTFFINVQEHELLLQYMFARHVCNAEAANFLKIIVWLNDMVFCYKVRNAAFFSAGISQKFECILQYTAF